LVEYNEGDSMHDKLKLLLEQINMPQEFHTYFKDGNLDKISVLKKESMVNFILTINNVLPVETYVKLCNLIDNHFSMYKSTKVIINVLDSSLDLINEYYNYLIEEYSVDYPLLHMFAGINLRYDGNILYLEVSNKAEEMKIESIKERLVQDLAGIGFKDLTIEIVINEEARNAILKQIEEEKEKEQLALKEEAEKKNAIIKGYAFDGDAKSISELNFEANNVIIEAQIFGIETRETPKINIITLKVTDYTDSIFVKVFERDTEAYNKLVKNLKPGNWFKMRGRVQDDAYSKELVMMANDIVAVKHNENNKIKDTAEEKRIELHAHTKMSQMDGLADEVELVKQAMAWGHKGIAITDHNGCQAFPHVFNTVTGYNKKVENPEEKFKVLYGAELTMVDDEVYTIVRGNDSKLDENIYVVFDVETTGFNAGLKDQMIEIGAVKIRDGEIIDRFDELINPGYPVDSEITEVTSITNAMLIGKPNEEEVVKRFKDFIEDLPLVAHNAKFDMSMLEMAYSKYGLGEVMNPVLDTLEISRTMDRDYSKHSLSALVKRYAIPFDEEHHHRADYDAEGTGYIFCKMIKKMRELGLETVNYG
jgi:DNA polymerase-3 subunit alpha (Gram-positive type)